MKYLFWNTYKNNKINEYIEKIVIKYLPDVFALAEYTDSEIDLIKLLTRHGIKYYDAPILGCNKIKIFTKYRFRSGFHCADSKRYTIKLLPYNLSSKHIVAFVHLPSKRNPDEGRMQAVITALNDDINKTRKKSHINKILIMGDFNMNPFENYMVRANGFHAISSRDIVGSKVLRKLDGISYPLYYNPMWNYMGDNTLPIGTHYYDAAGYETYFWNMFDQFIISAELIGDLELSKVHIINEIDGIKLEEKQEGKFVVSDHLPIYFELGGL